MIFAFLRRRPHFPLVVYMLNYRKKERKSMVLRYCPLYALTDTAGACKLKQLQGKTEQAALRQSELNGIK